MKKTDRREREREKGGLKERVEEAGDKRKRLGGAKFSR